MITAIDFFSVNCGTPYLVIAPEHYLFINGEWVLNRTVVFGSFNSLLWENRVIMHRTSIEGGKLYSHILRSKYSPQVFMESECEYSTKHSLTVHDDELRFNASYSLMVNSSVVSNGIISSDASIFETSGLEIGDTIHPKFEDGYGNSFNNSKIVRIVKKKTVITRNFQTNFSLKARFFFLNWTVVDNSVRNPVYSIFINGDLLIKMKHYHQMNFIRYIFTAPRNVTSKTYSNEGWRHGRINFWIIVQAVLKKIMI